VDFTNFAGFYAYGQGSMEDMRKLQQVLSLRGGERKPRFRLERLSKTQVEVLSVFGYRVDASGVLQQTDR
jgi:hypothetical protein